jgi:Leucine-rich repeat (LRR) protein
LNANSLIKVISFVSNLKSNKVLRKRHFDSKLNSLNILGYHKTKYKTMKYILPYCLTGILLAFSLNAQVTNTPIGSKVFYDLKSANIEPKNVVMLNLTHQNINPDSLDLSYFINLETLILSYDNLKNLPKGLEKLQKLKVLDISANNFKLLPESLSLIPNLEELYLNNEKYLDLNQSFIVINKITHLKRLHLDSIPDFKFPKHIGLNSSIEYISLRYDGINKIPNELRKIRHLKDLDLEGNSIGTIDKDFLKNKEIESLNLSVSSSFDFKKSVKVLSKEQSLKALTISNSRIDSIPKEISLLKNIKSLSFHNDHLTTFPVGILYLKNLKNLDLSGNDFNALPPSFVKLDSLETLDLSTDKYLNFDQTAELIKKLPRLKLVQVGEYDYTLDNRIYLNFKQNTDFVELFPQRNQNSNIHLFKGIKQGSMPPINPPLENFNPEGFGVKIGW